MVKLGLILSILLVLAGCLPQAKQQSCGQGNVFNSTSRTCVPVTSGGQTSGVSIAGRNPSVSNFTISRTSGTSLNFSVSINNPLNQGYSINWMLYAPNGTSSQISSGGSGSASFIPAIVFNSSSIGVWTVAAEIMSSPGNVLVTQTQWFLNVVETPTPTLDKTTNPPLSISNNPLPTSFSVQVNNPGNTSNLAVVWYYNGVQDSSVSTTSAAIFPNSRTLFNPAYLSLLSDKPPLLTGPATIRVELRQSTAFGNLYDFVEWPLFVNPPIFPTISNPLPILGTALSGINSITLANGGIKNSGTPLTVANAFCVTVSSGMGSTNAAGSVRVEYSKNAGAPVAIYVVPSPGGQICLGTTLSNFNNFSLALTNPNVGEVQTVVAKVIDNNTTIATLSWPVSVLPVNTPPTISKDSPTGAGPFTHLVGTSSSYSINVQDNEHPDQVTAPHTYSWYFGGVLMNGTNTYPGTSIRTAACTGTGVAFKTCTFVMPAYNLNGRLQHNLTNLGIVNTLSVIVQDPGGPLGFPAAPLTSTTETWNLKPLLVNTAPIATAPVIAPNGTNTCTPYFNQVVVGQAFESCGLLPLASNRGNSFIAMASSPTTPIDIGVTPLNENADIVFNILVEDSERDNFTININCISSTNVPCASPPVHNATVLRTNDSFGRRVIIPYKIHQSSLVGVASGQISYRVTINDQVNYLTDLIGGNTNLATNIQAQMDFVVATLNNVNPAPSFTPGLQAPVIGSTSDVVIGSPFTIDPGPITDASTSDGVNILYQWQVRNLTTAGAWKDITGASQRVLKWTPHKDSIGSLLELRLCLGDDGTGNALSACGVSVGGWSINPRANALESTLAGTIGDSATWTLKDSTRQEFYSAFATTSGNIIVEKYRFNSSASLEIVSTIQFKAEKDGASVDISRLSLKGHSTTVSGKIYRGLYLSYVTKSTGAPLVDSKMRVRYIDITDTDDLIFSYSGIYWSGCLNSGTKVYDSACISSPTIAPFTVNFSITPIVRDISLNLSAGIPAGSQIVINGVKLTSVLPGAYTNFLSDPTLGWAVGVGAPCEFTGDSVGNLDHLAEIISESYNACKTNQPDLRFIQGTASFATNVVTFPAMPSMAVDINFPIAFGRVGELIVSNNVLSLPYLDNNEGGKLAVAVVRLKDAAPFNYRGLASEDVGFEYAAAQTYRPLASTVGSQDLATSSSAAGTFDVALVTSLNKINYHRFAITPTGTSANYTLDAASTKLNVFDTVSAVEKPRIATGLAATNNNVFILAQDVVAPNELQFARISPLAWGMEVFSPLDQNHVQTKSLKDYKISADNCGGNYNGVILSAYTLSNLSLISTLRTPSPVNAGVFIYPEFFQDPNLINGFDYPVLGAGNITTGIAIGQSFNLEGVGNAGSVVNENNTCALSVAHSSVLRAQSTIVNIKPTPINATQVDSTLPNAGLFQPAYIK